MRFFCFFFLVSTMATTIYSASTIKRCTTNCPLANATTAVCGFRKISDTNFQYKDFISNCGLNNGNCGVTNPASIYTAISEPGVSCAQLANVLSPRYHILPYPVTGTAVPLSG